MLAAVAVAIGFYLGERNADPPGCDDPGHCSLGMELGFLWGGFALTAVVIVAVGVEVALRLRSTAS